MKASWWKNVRKGAVIGVCALSVISLIGGCGSDQGSAKKDMLRIGSIKFADNLEPTDNYYGWAVMRMGIGEALTKFDEKMNIQPWIAQSYSVSDDKMTWTFTIKDKVTFSNGKPVTAEAVKSSIERTFKKSKRASKFFTYDSIEAKGQTLVIKTSKPTPNLPGFLADPLFIIVDASADGTKDFAKEGPIATGPYKVVSFTKDLTVVEANESYWGGPVPIKKVEFPAISDGNARALALKGGEIDGAIVLNPDDVANFKTDKKVVVYEIPSLRTVLAKMNFNGVLKDHKIRSAVISGTNRESYATTLLKGAFIGGKAPIPPSLDYGFNQLKDPNPYNPDRAKQLLQEAGYTDSDHDGYVDKDGKNLTLNFVIYTNRTELPQYAEAVQSDLKKIGIKVDVKAVDYSVAEQLNESGDFDLLITNLNVASTGDPQIFLSTYFKTNENGDNPMNGGHYTNPKYDELMDQLATEFDIEKRKALIIEAQQLLLDDSAALFLGYPKITGAFIKGVEGFKMYPSEYYWLNEHITFK